MIEAASPYTHGMAKETRTPMTTDREKVVGVRLSEAEHAKIAKAAQMLGLKVSQYLRMVGLRASDRDGES